MKFFLMGSICPSCNAREVYWEWEANQCHLLCAACGNQSQKFYTESEAHQAWPKASFSLEEWQAKREELDTRRQAAAKKGIITEF